MRAAGPAGAGRRTADKRAQRDLAYYGGPSALSAEVRVGTPNVPDKERFLELVSEAIDRRWLTNLGPLAGEFEARTAQWTGRRHGIAAGNATTALQVAARACGFRGEVVMPSFTFVATAHAMEWIGLTPVFADVDPETGTLDPDSAARAITPRTGGVLGVHVWGNLCDTAGLAEVARAAGVPLLIDAAQAFGCRPLEPRPGGAAEVFSFHATKILNCFEGGLIATDSDALAARVRALHNFGFNGSAEVSGPGTNAKMSEASAAMGVASLEHFDAVAETYRDRYRRYRDGLAGIPGISVVPAPDSQTHNHPFVVVRVDPGAAGLDRDRLHDILGAENARTKKYFSPGCHRMPPYAGGGVHTPVGLSATETLTSQVLALPTGPATEPEDVDAICGVVAAAVRYA